MRDKKSSFDSIYNLSAEELEILRVYIDEHLEKKFITFSVSLVSALILFAKKSNDSFRLCVDYRDLNVIIKKNRYSLSLINETLNRLLEAKIYIKFDFRAAYNQIRIKKDDE